MKVWILVGHDDVFIDVLGCYVSESSARQAAEEFGDYEEFDLMEMEVLG